MCFSDKWPQSLNLKEPLAPLHWTFSSHAWGYLSSCCLSINVSIKVCVASDPWPGIFLHTAANLLDVKSFLCMDPSSVNWCVIGCLPSYVETSATQTQSWEDLSTALDLECADRDNSKWIANEYVCILHLHARTHTGMLMNAVFSVFSTCMKSALRWPPNEAITLVICVQLLIFLQLRLKLFWFMAAINVEDSRSAVVPQRYVYIFFFSICIKKIGSWKKNESATKIDYPSGCVVGCAFQWRQTIVNLFQTWAPSAAKGSALDFWIIVNL